LLAIRVIVVGRFLLAKLGSMHKTIKQNVPYFDPSYTDARFMMTQLITHLYSVSR